MLVKLCTETVSIVRKYGKINRSCCWRHRSTSYQRYNERKESITRWNDNQSN